MGGLTRLFMRILPIITLICFICFGITYTFESADIHDITYLSTETINVGTQENPNNITLYQFDTKSYIENVNVNILKEATTKTIEFDKYMHTYDNFNIIWQDGYKAGAVTQTILNGVLLLVNTLILPINILLVPMRITAGLLLTAFSLIGINIGTETPGPIITMNQFILHRLAIPLIDPTEEYGTTPELAGTQWYIKTPQKRAGTFTVNFTAYVDGTLQNFTSIDYEKSVIIYGNGQGGVTIYNSKNGGWLHEESRYITITTDWQSTTNKIQNQWNYLEKIATQITEEQAPSLTNTTWIFNDKPELSQSISFSIQFTSNQTQYTELWLSKVAAQNIIQYHTNNLTNTAYINPQGWTNNEYKTITITNANNLTQEETNYLTQILQSIATKQ